MIKRDPVVVMIFLLILIFGKEFSYELQWRKYEFGARNNFTVYLVPLSRI